VDPKEDLSELWPLLPYERPKLQKIPFWTSKRPIPNNLPGRKYQLEEPAASQ
jgi:hypothetical protein